MLLGPIYWRTWKADRPWERSKYLWTENIKEAGLDRESPRLGHRRQSLGSEVTQRRFTMGRNIQALVPSPCSVICWKMPRESMGPNSKAEESNAGISQSSLTQIDGKLFPVGRSRDTQLMPTTGLRRPGNIKKKNDIFWNFMFFTGKNFCS